MVEIRNFTHEDAEALRQSLYPDMTLSGISEMIDEWNSRVHLGKYFEMFAVISDGRIAGCVSLYERSRSAASIGAEIFPEERGKGTASKAVSLLLELASEKGYGIILDQVRRDNTASIRLHEKLGFETDGYVFRNRRDHEVYLYLKRI